MEDKWSKILTVSSTIILFVFCTGYLLVNTKTDGIVDYYVWKVLSNHAGKGNRLEINDITLYYEIHGKGEPLLLLHGGTAFIECLYKQIPVLAEKYRIIAPDSRAHGRSTDSEKPLGYGIMADDMFKLLEKLNIEKTHIVGWSDGGIIGLDLAMEHPERVDKLVVIGSNFRADGLTAKALNFNSIATPDMEKFAPVRDFYQSIAPEPEYWPDFFKKVISMWKNQPNYALSQLRTIKSPTLVVVGENDDIKIEHTRQMVDAIPNTELVIVPEATHLVPLEKPHVVNQSILEFLK